MKSIFWNDRVDRAIFGRINGVIVVVIVAAMFFFTVLEKNPPETLTESLTQAAVLVAYGGQLATVAIGLAYLIGLYVQRRRIEFAAERAGFDGILPAVEEFERRMVCWRKNFRLGDRATWNVACQEGDHMPTSRDNWHAALFGVLDCVQWSLVGGMITSPLISLASAKSSPSENLWILLMVSSLTIWVGKRRLLGRLRGPVRAAVAARTADLERRLRISEEARRNNPGIVIEVH